VTTLVIVVLALAVVALLVNLIVTRRRRAPLERLIEEMEKVDLSRPGPLLPRSIDGVGETEEVERIELAFLRMMRRLEAERRRAGSAALHAQEEERARVARDLHDEVNQSLTGLLLRLEAAREAAPPQLEAELEETKALANQAMRELLSLARQLRPTALDDLGLAAAVAGQVEQLARGEIAAEFAAEGEFSDLGDDAQLVVYRVAQEALSNAARHSGAGTPVWWMYKRSNSAARDSQCRPSAGSITWTQSPFTRHTTTKCVIPEGSRKTLSVEHPTGEMSCVLEVNDQREVASAALLRTARKLMDGVVFA